MPTTTAKGINYPVGPDRYNATNAFGALATTTDAAIQASEARAVSQAAAIVQSTDAATRDYLAGVLAAHDLGNVTDEDIDNAVTRVLESNAWKANQSKVAHVADFGAKGDGITDDTTAIRDALATGKHVEFSNAVYKISGGFTVPSGTVVNGNGATLTSDKAISVVFTIAGTASATNVNLVGNYDSHATRLKTQIAHGLTEGEVFRLVGQRCAGSSDAPLDDRLGMSTGNSGVPWFGEYLKVRQVVSPTEFITSSGLIFNGYRDNNAQESHAQARERTTLNRMNWAERSVVQGFKVDLSCTYAVRMDYAKDCVVRDLHEIHRANAGYVVGATGCYRCVITDVHTEYPTNPPASFTDYWLRNAYKLMACQNVIIDRCTADGGEQVVDLTYIASAMIPTIACTVRNCTFIGYDTNAVTTHPGVWGAVIEGNDFRAANTSDAESSNGHAVASGIGIRSPYSVIRGNQVHARQRGDGTSDGNFGNYGIHLYDGGGHHCQVEGNQISGFDIGIGTADGNESPERHGTLYTTISGNWLEDCMHSIRLRKSGLTNVWSGVGVMGNYITSKWANAVGINMDASGTGKTRGAAVMNNRMHFTGTGQTPIALGSAVDPVLVGNVVTGTATRLYSTPDSAANGQLALAANVVTNASGTTLYPAPGTGGGGSVSVRPDPTVDGAILIGD